MGSFSCQHHPSPHPQHSELPADHPGRHGFDRVVLFLSSLGSVSVRSRVCRDDMVELIDADRAPSSRRRVVSGETYSDTPLGGPDTTPYMVCQSGQKQTLPRRATGTKTPFLAALGSIKLTQAPTALFRPPWPALARLSATNLPKPGGSCAGAAATGPIANSWRRGCGTSPFRKITLYLQIMHNAPTNW